jgi:hypothetical protein
MKQLTNEQLSFLLQFPTGHRLQVGALSYIEKNKIEDVNILFEATKATQNIIDVFNKKLEVLDEKKRKKCTIYPTDSGNKIRKKCKQAHIWGIHYAPVWNRYMQPEPTTPGTDGGADVGGDTGGGDAGGDAGGMAERKGIAGSLFTYPMSTGPDDDYQLKDEAMSSTERMRRFNKRHPEKVRKYLKKTQDDRVARNRDRRKAVEKHGKAKMKNHDVHHPNGAQNGNWKLAKKDHGRDKKNENIEYVYLSELAEGFVPNGSWTLIYEGGAAGHMAHPYEDDSLSFTDVKDMVTRGLVGDLGAEEPVTEKLDGQNIMFTVRDGQVYFARNKSQVKSKGKNALDAAGIRQKFAGRGDIEKAFTGAAEDLQRAIDALPEEERSKMFADGSKFMNVEIVFPDTKNVIPYDKSVLVFHGTVEYDDEGNELKRSVEDGRELSNQLTKVNAQQQKTFGISGPKTISFSDAQTVENKEALKQIGKRISQIQQEYGLDDKSTIEDYKTKWWEDKLIQISQETGLEFTKQEFEGMVRRWALGDKKFKVSDIEDPEKKKWFRQFEGSELKNMQREAVRPLESVFLQVGAMSLRRVTDFLSANNPEMANKLKAEVLDAIKQIQQSGDANKLSALQVQLERLQDIGMDKIVPTEGMVFMYKGKPYKFTGTFAPVNQILGTLKFDKGAAKFVDEPEETPKEEPTTKSAEGKQRTVAIFTGRFQPFHAGHYSIYKSMVDKFGKENVYIASSDKTEAGKSPFKFNDKKEIMTQMFDIPEDMVVQVKNPYSPKEILEKLPPETVYVTAVSQKDSERLGGKYFQPYDEKGPKKGFADQGYFMVAPELQVDIDGKNISGTQLRAIFGNPNITDEVKQEIFAKVYGKFDQDIFDKVVKTTTKSEEELKITKKFAEPDKAAQKPEVPAEKKPAVKKPVDTTKSDDVSQYQPGETWQTAGGNFGGKNKQNQIKYFGTIEKAKQFATK